MDHKASALFIVLVLLICGIPLAGGQNNDTVNNAKGRDDQGQTSLSLPRSLSEKNLQGGSWSEEFDQGPTAELNWTQNVDGKVQLMIDTLTWTKNVNNPVLTLNPGHFDAVTIRGNTVLYENGIYKMWYTGYNGGSGRIGYAISLDGKNWIRQNSGNPVLALGGPGSWDDSSQTNPWVLKVGNTYNLYYAGNDGAIATIGLATSFDGINWVKNGNNPILTAGGGFDSVHVYGCAVIKEANIYKMWYTGNDGSGMNGDNVGYATSANGIAWNRQNNGNQVINRGAGGKFDSNSIAVPWVGRVGTRYIMYYTGYDGSASAIGAAESFDGIAWTKFNNGNPVLNHGGGAAWDSSRMLEHSIVMINNRYYLWYAGGTTNLDTQIGLATATNYMTSGFVRSKKISLDPGMSWDGLVLKKAEPAGTSIKITVQNGATGQPVAGFTDRSESDINISNLNVLGVSSFYLNATLSGPGTATPSLYYWGVDYTAQNAWRTSFIGGKKTTSDPEIWVRKGEAVLDGDPTTWTKSASNPILTFGSGGSWDSSRVTHPDVLYNGTGYQMFYTGSDTNTQTPQIGMATSADGLAWNKDASNPVLHNGGGAWDTNQAVGTSSLYNDDGYNAYKTWYTGYDGINWRIGYAVSTTGKAWTENSQNPVLDSTGGGTWDDGGVLYPTVLFINGTYMLWYEGWTGSNGELGYASSRDGVSFTKPANSLVMTPSNGQFDSHLIMSPSAIYRRDQFYLFYNGNNGAKENIGYATSTDGIAWTKQNNVQPVISNGANGEWDTIADSAPSVFFKDGLYHCYFMGGDGSMWRIGYAKSNYYTTGAITTEKTALPGNGIWNKILVNKTEPGGTSVTVDVLDAGTENPISGFTGLTGTSIDIRGLSAKDHPSVKLKIHLTGDGTKTPTIGDIGINWTIAKVEFKGPIPDVSFLEDTYGDNLTNFSNYFNQSRVGPTKLTYSIASNTDPTHVAAIFDADKIHIDYKSQVANWSGSAKLSLKATDGFTNATSNVFTVTVTPVNDPPLWKNIPTQWLEGNRTYTNKLDLKSYVTDIDTVAGNMTFALVLNERPNNLTVAVQAKGAVNFTTKNYFSGFVNLTVSVNDKTTTVPMAFKVHINWSAPPPPVPHYHPPHVVTSPGTHATVGVQYKYDVNATDEDAGDVLVYMLKSAPANMTINPFDGMITWTPTKGQVGTQHIILNVSDQRGMYDLQTYDLLVEAPNEPPYFISLPVTTARVGEQWTYVPKAKDNDSLFLFIMMQSGPPSMTIDLLGTNMTWMPGTAGNFKVVIYAWDLQAKTYQNFTITVLPQNHPPTMGLISSATIKVGEKYQDKVIAQDPDGDSLTYSIKDMPAGMSIGADGTITWTPKKQDSGLYTLTVVVSDGKLNASQTYTLKVEKKIIPKTMLESFLWLWVLLIIIIVIIVTILIVYSRKKKDDKEAEVDALAAQTSPSRQQPHRKAYPPTPPTPSPEIDDGEAKSPPPSYTVEEVEMDFDEEPVDKMPPDTGSKTGGPPKK